MAGLAMMFVLLLASRAEEVASVPGTRVLREPLSAAKAALSAA